jgi:hypothetical protein
MSADLLRRAATLMRERAEEASVYSRGQYRAWRANGRDVAAGLSSVAAVKAQRNEVAYPRAEHIASWHPAVALAVADWLDVSSDAGHQDTCATRLSPDANYPCSCPHEHAVAVARAYLGEEA